jgi:hypothetical protein
LFIGGNFLRAGASPYTNHIAQVMNFFCCEFLRVRVCVVSFWSLLLCNILFYSGWAVNSCPWALDLMVLYTLLLSCRHLSMLEALFPARSRRGGLPS